MNELLDIAAFPLAFFVKVAAVDRPTIENWMRSGSLVPAKRVEGDKTPLGGHAFSMRNLIKVEMMHRLRDGIGVQPRAAAAIADALIEENEELIAAEFKAAAKIVAEQGKQGLTYEGIGKPTVYAMSRGPDGLPAISTIARGPDDFHLIAPVAAIARLAFAKFELFASWAEVELPKLRADVVKWKTDASAGAE